MASVQASTPTKKRRRTNAQIDDALQDSLINVFKALADNNLSLRDFLVATFSSSQQNIAHRVGQFYRREGPAAIIRLWREKLVTTDHDKTFAMEAINVVANRVQADLENAAKNKSFKHPANSISRKTIRNFSLERLQSSLENSAPHLTLLLEKLLPQSRVDFHPSSEWRSRAFQEPIPCSTAERPSWLSVRRLESDSDAASEKDTGSEQDTTLDRDSSPDLPSVTEPQWEQDADWEDDPDPNPHKNPRSFIVTVGCMLLFMKNPRSNCFQMMIGTSHWCSFYYRIASPQ